MGKMDDSFLSYASDILCETNSGLSGLKMVEYLNAYAIDFNVRIPHGSYPFAKDVPNKRSALKDNLRNFSDVQQFRIIKDLSELSKFKDDEEVKKLRLKLYTRYGNLAMEKISETELAQKTKHWLESHPNALQQYNSALQNMKVVFLSEIHLMIFGLPLNFW